LIISAKFDISIAIGFIKKYSYITQKNAGNLKKKNQIKSLFFTFIFFCN